MISPTARRNWLGKHIPPCPQCGEEWQIQLIAYIATYPAKWKCRICKTTGYHEPEETQHETP